jgi:hypothetical protein
MYPRFRRITVFVVLFTGVFLFTSQVDASRQMAQSSSLERGNIIQSDARTLNVAQSKQGNQAREGRCLEMAKKAEEALKKAEKVAEEARKAAKELRESTKEAEKTGNFEAAKEAKAKAEKAVEDARNAAGAARRVAEEAWNATCVNAFKRAEAAENMAEDAAKETMEAIGEVEKSRERVFPQRLLDPQTSEQERYQYERREKEVSPSQ